MAPSGRPTEHFVPWFPGADAPGHPYAGFERSAWARARGIDTFPEFLDAAVREGSTPNGIFATKLVWNALEGFLERLGEVEGCRDVAPEARPRWDDFFARAGVQPLRLWYEDLVADLESSLLGVIRWLGAVAPERLDLGALRHQPQATALNAEWEARFRALRPGA
jgi:LPS sulfotransferase NodH